MQSCWELKHVVQIVTTVIYEHNRQCTRLLLLCQELHTAVLSFRLKNLIRARLSNEFRLPQAFEVHTFNHKTWQVRNITKWQQANVLTQTVAFITKIHHLMQHTDVKITVEQTGKCRHSASYSWSTRIAVFWDVTLRGLLNSRALRKDLVPPPSG
jgi:hypothetical protein